MQPTLGLTGKAGVFYKSVAGAHHRTKQHSAELRA